jgi:hypothetical protein
MPTTLGAAARHPAGQLAGVDDAAGVAGAVDDEELDEPEDFDGSEEPEEEDLSEDPEPLVAAPAVTDEPERESERESVR